MFGSKPKKTHFSGGTDYKQMFEEASSMFWDLQQVEQTPEEKEYDLACRELEEMCTQFKEEVDELEKENKDIQQNLESYSAFKKRYELLKNREAMLQKLKSVV